MIAVWQALRNLNFGRMNQLMVGEGGMEMRWIHAHLDEAARIEFDLALEEYYDSELSLG